MEACLGGGGPVGAVSTREDDETSSGWFRGLECRDHLARYHHFLASIWGCMVVVRRYGSGHSALLGNSGYYYEDFWSLMKTGTSRGLLRARTSGNG